MKILQIVADGAPGGGTTHVLQLLDNLGSGYESVLMTQRDSYLYELAQSKGIEVIGGDFFRSRFDRQAVKAIDSAIQQVQPQLVHCHGGRSGFFTSFVKQRPPVVYTVHGFHYPRKSFVARTLGWAAEYWTIRRLDKVLFVAEYDRELALKDGLLPSQKLNRVIHNGIAPLQPVDTNERLGVGFVGRFVFQKNPQLFLDVVEQLPNVKFVMAGGGELDEEVRAEIQSRNLGKRIELLGSLDHASALDVISRLDILLMTPRWEGLPLLPLEAMFMKVPVVSTAVGGIPEIITHNVNGMLSENEDGAELAAHVKTLLEDSDFRKTIVENAYQSAMSEFSQDKMLERIRGAYLQTLNAIPSLESGKKKAVFSHSQQEPA